MTISMRARSIWNGRKQVALAAAIFLGFGTAGGTASAAGLFTAAPQASARATAAVLLPLAAVRSRLVLIDASELSRHVAPLGSDIAPDRVRRAERLDGVVVVELFPGVAATFRRTTIETVGDSGVVWSGAAGGAPTNAIDMFVEAGQITGTVELGSRFYRIDPLGGRLHRVTEIDRSALPYREDDFIVPDNIPEGEDQSGPSVPKAVSNIRVLVAYTKRAKNRSANIVSEIKLAMRKANRAYDNTQIPIKLILADTMSTGNYDEGADTGVQWQEVLEDVSGQHGNKLIAVRDKRDAVKADLVALVVGTQTYCGLAWYIERPRASTSNFGFSENAVGCLAGGIVFPHEVGHNMGLNHDRKTHADTGGGNPSSQYYSFGYINDNAHKIDIMAYQSSCAPPFSCDYVPWFSTSEFKFPGNVKLGIAKGKAGAADATRRLGETRTGVAKYR